MSNKNPLFNLFPFMHRITNLFGLLKIDVNANPEMNVNTETLRNLKQMMYRDGSNVLMDMWTSYANSDIAIVLKILSDETVRNNMVEDPVYDQRFGAVSEIRALSPYDYRALMNSQGIKSIQPNFDSRSYFSKLPVMLARDSYNRRQLIIATASEGDSISSHISEYLSSLPGANDLSRWLSAKLYMDITYICYVVKISVELASSKPSSPFDDERFSKQIYDLIDKRIIPLSTKFVAAIEADLGIEEGVHLSVDTSDLADSDLYSVWYSPVDRSRSW